MVFLGLKRPDKYHLRCTGDFATWKSQGSGNSRENGRTEVPGKIINARGLQKAMFEAADPEVFAWYIKDEGPEVNLFVDHSQIVPLAGSSPGPGANLLRQARHARFREPWAGFIDPYF